MYAIERIRRVNDIVQGRASDRDVTNLAPVFSEAVGVANGFARQNQILDVVGALSPSEHHVLVLAGLTAHAQTWADPLVHAVRIPSGPGGLIEMSETLVRSPGLDKWVTELMVELCTFDFADGIFLQVGRGIKGAGEQDWQDVVNGLTVPGWEEGATPRERSKAIEKEWPGLTGLVIKAIFAIRDAVKDASEKGRKGGERPDRDTLNDAPKGLTDHASTIAREGSDSFTYVTRPKQCRIEAPLAEALVKDLNKLRAEYVRWQRSQEMDSIHPPQRKRDDDPPPEKPPRED